MLRKLLLPFTWLYGTITDIRNQLYDQHFFTSTTTELLTISVGNLTVGGTGKTPQIEYLIRLLQQRYQLATLSRGYGRRTRGFRIVGKQDTPETVGDEPLQVYQKFHNIIQVTVGEKRVEALRKIQQQLPQVNLVLLDDAYQYRALMPHLSLLLTDYNRLFYKDFSFPAGNLRERRKGARRADALIVTKCPDGLSADEKITIYQKINLYKAANVPIFFSGIRYSNPIQADTHEPVRDTSQPFVLVSGLARPELFEHYARKNYTIVKHLAFADHHAYSAIDWNTIVAAGGKAILTTEKDAVKLNALNKGELPLYVLPIETYFLEGAAFNEWLLNRLQNQDRTI
ncbi:MAG: tetraacyldisaccharide 4'-kinase [Siphonobacter sp.]